MENLTTQQNKANTCLLAGLKNLREGLNHFSLEQFVINTLALLMLILIERDEYLKNLKDNHFKDIPKQLQELES